MDGFSNEYKRHMIYTHVLGPETGPWVANYSVLAINDQSELYSVLHGTATGAFSSFDVATSAASEQARQRIEDFLVQRERHAGEALGQRL